MSPGVCQYRYLMDDVVARIRGDISMNLIYLNQDLCHVSIQSWCLARLLRDFIPIPDGWNAVIEQWAGHSRNSNRLVTSNEPDDDR